MEFRSQVEPGAATYSERLAALRRLHKQGYKTWISMEPYPTPNLIAQDLDEILETLAFTDKIIFGRTNYNKEVSSYKRHKEFFNEQARKVIGFCNTHDIQYHIKDGTMSKLVEAR